MPLLTRLLRRARHEYDVGLHTEPYINRDLIDYEPRLMRFFTRGAQLLAGGRRVRVGSR